MQRLNWQRASRAYQFMVMEGLSLNNVCSSPGLYASRVEATGCRMGLSCGPLVRGSSSNSRW